MHIGTILLVDDLEANRYSLSHTLKDQNYKIIEAVDASSARKALVNYPDLIILDIKLPDESGYDLCLEIKSSIEFSNIPIILTSANFIRGEDHLKGIECGADAYLTSPIDPYVLIGTVKTWIKVKIIEKEREEARELFKNAFEHTSVGMAIANLDGTFVTTNEAYARITGRDRSELSQESIRSLSLPADYAENASKLEALIAGKVEAITITMRYVRKDGEHIWITNTISCSRDSKGGLKNLVLITEDISDQRKLQDSLIDSEKQFRNLAELMPQIVWTARPDGIVDWYNKGWYDYTGLSPDQSWEAEGVMHPDDIAPTHKRWNESLKSGEFYEMEYRFRRKSDNKYRWHLGRAVPIKDQKGKIVRWLGTNTDIHDKIEAELILEKQNELFKSIAETIPQGIWRTNVDGSADFFSKRFAELVGYPVEDLLMWGWSKLIHTEDRPRVLDEWQKSRDQGIPVSVDFRVKQKSGDYRWFLSLGNPYKDETGNIVKYYGTWTDIEDHKKAQERLTEAVNARDEFLSIASHELKTPLTSLKLQTQVFFRTIEKKGELAYTKERMDSLAIQTDKQVNRLTRLVDDMLDISRIRTGRLSIEPERIELCALLKEVYGRMRIQYKSEIDLKLDCPSDLELYVDPLRIEQVINNLLTNAIRYGKNLPVSICLQDLKHEVRIDVLDQGMGIAPENLEIIFDRFERAVSANEVSGLGLGLYISKQIVKAHNGRIEVESEMNKGSIFSVFLPKDLSEIN